MKWKGSTQRPKDSSEILCEISGKLYTGTCIEGKFKIAFVEDLLTFNIVDKWMYESEAKRILFEHSWPNIKYMEDS